MITYIPRSQLEPHPDNPRQELGDLTELAASIKKSGLLQNLTVVPSPVPGKYRIIIGHRRFAASEIAGLDELPCTVEDMDLATQVATMLAENMQRSDLTIADQVSGVQTMLDLGEDIKAIAEKTGLSATTVRRRAKLTDLNAESLKKAEDRGATLMDLIELTKIEDPALREEVLSVAGTANFADKLLRAKNQETAAREFEKCRLLIEPWAKMITRDEWNKTRCVSNYERSIELGTAGADFNRPDSPEDTRFVCVYTPMSKYMTVYRILGEAVPDDGAVQREREARIRQARCAACDEMRDHAYQLRAAFMRDQFRGGRDATNAVMTFVRKAVLECGGCHLNPNDRNRYAEMLGERTEPNPVLEAGCALFCLFEGGFTKLNYASWNGKHEANAKLDAVYEFLTSVGYEMSDDELAWKEGTHPCFTDPIIDEEEN